jgi:vesicle-associated membrane protein 7
MILRNLSSENDKGARTWKDEYIFHYLVHNGITYLCMADAEMKYRMPFAFLDDIKGKLLGTYGTDCDTSLAFSLDAEFAPVLQQRMQFFNSDEAADNISVVRSEIHKARDTLADDIDLLVLRGQKVDQLADKADNLNEQANVFKKKAIKVKKDARKSKWKCICFGITIFFIVAYFAAMMVCKGPLLEGCIK